MAEVCIFCGKPLSMFNQESLLCGNVSQPACKNCWKRYFEATPAQRARLALETGRALKPEAMETYLKELEVKEAREAKVRACQRELLRCCGREMQKQGEYTLRHREGLFEGFVPTMAVFCCENCGQLKFFDASFLFPEEKALELPPEPDPIPAEEQPVKRSSREKPPWEK